MNNVQTQERPKTGFHSLIDSITRHLSECPGRVIEGTVSVKPLGPSADGGYHVSRVYSLNGSQPVTTHPHYFEEQTSTRHVADAIGVLSSHLFPNVVEARILSDNTSQVTIRARKPEDTKR